MATKFKDHSKLSIVPLGAGDLVDRAVRFYRGNFLTLILIAAPPVLVGTILSVGWTLLARSLFFSGGYDAFESTLFVLFSGIGSLTIWFAESIITLTVMGGASRNFVRHLLHSEPISFKDTYRNLWDRIGALLSASALITILLGIIGLFVFYFGFGLGAVLVMMAAVALESIPVLAFIVSAVLFLGVLVSVYFLFCLIAVRFALIPQAIMVEGQGVLASFGRSFSLSGGNVKRFAALLIFTIVATYSSLAIIYVPLGWYAWVEGIDVFSLGVGELTPAWYEIASQLSWQLSIIVLSPVWMIGLCLLYVDERVRKEGFDIELMAARELGEIPAVPQAYHNPLQPALGELEQPLISPQYSSSPGTTTLGLK